MEPAQIPWFPAWGIEFQSPVKDPKKLVETWLEIRASERWVMISETVAASERHLWGVWSHAARNELLGKMVARTIDAEFIRILSGTHQIRVAFERAGVRKGDKHAWILCLPEHPGFDAFGQSKSYPSHDRTQEIEASKAMSWLNGDLWTARPSPNSDGLDRLGLNRDLKFEQIESSMLSHAASADI
tara:strand:- start:64 stop:621 length:558 start_codon:yes stop_codon:yes gene_type:complete